MERTIDECFFQIQNGANIKQGNIDGGFPITRIETTANDKFNRDRMGYAGITDISKYESYVLEDGDLLMSHINSAQYLGRTVLYEKQEDETIIHGMNLLRLKARRDIINPAYARYCFYAHHFRSQVANITKKSVNQASFAVTDLKKIKIDVPEMEEQNCVVDKLDRIRCIIDQRNEELEQLDNLIKARFVELFVDKGYPEKTVKDVLTTAFWLMPATPEFIDAGEIPYITSKNIKDQRIDFDNVKYISREAYEMISSNRPTQIGDVLVSMIGTLGQTAVISDDREFYGQNLYLLRLDNAIIDTDYFCEYFNTDTTQHLLQGKRNQSTQAYLKANHVEDLVLPIPPLEEQKAFAEFVKQVDKSKVAVQKALDETQKLFDSLMQEYFG